MPPYRDVLPATSGLWETCARHTSRAVTRVLQTIYLCDPCAVRLVREAFNDRPPVYHGETIESFCGLCNDKKAVTMRQWFVCPICWNVVTAYQKSIAASAAVHAWWQEAIAPLFAALRLEETEPVYLSPFARAGKTKKQAAVTLAVLDFQVLDASGDPAVPLFHIEQKTGPGSIETMTEFQLDVNDYDDIVGAVNHTGLPAYVVHVQAESEYAFPARRAVISGLWWTDIHTLWRHQKAVRGRRGEDKDAIYYEPVAFQPIETFISELERRGYVELAAKLKASPLKPVG